MFFYQSDTGEDVSIKSCVHINSRESMDNKLQRRNPSEHEIKNRAHR